jgi:hypothetical protein
VVQQFGKFSLDPEVHKDRARAWCLVLPPRVGEGLQIVGQQLCLGEMKVGARHHDVRFDRVLCALCVPVGHTRCLRAVVFVDGDACGLSQIGQIGVFKFKALLFAYHDAFGEYGNVL